MTAESRKIPMKKSSWEPVRVLIHEETRIATRVSRLNIRPYPRYTFEIGYVDAEERFHRFIEPKVTVGENGVAELEAIDEDAITSVKELAEQYIVEEIQKREHELQLQRKSRPKKKIDTKLPTT